MYPLRPPERLAQIKTSANVSMPLLRFGASWCVPCADTPCAISARGESHTRETRRHCVLTQLTTKSAAACMMRFLILFWVSLCAP